MKRHKTRKVHTCECGAQIVFIQMPSGKRMPCNIPPVLYREGAGKATVVTPDGRIVRNAGLDCHPIDSTGHGYISHFSTCPKRAVFQKSKTPKTGTEPVPEQLTLGGGQDG